MPRLRYLIALLVVGIAVLALVYLFVDRLVAVILSAALLLVSAGFVAKKLAPRSPYDLRIEQDGKILIFLTVGLGFAALNTGSNLLYLILGILLSLILVSGLLSQRVLMYVRISRTFPGLIRAGIPVIYKTTTHNRKRWFPSYNLLLSVKADTVVDSAGTFIQYVAPKGTSEVFSNLTFRRRGLIDIKSLNDELATRFPFGFFTKKL